MTQDRREFFKRSAAAGALATVPYMFASAADKPTSKAGNKLTVAAIGVGGSRGAFSQGGHIARQAGALGRLTAVCDVDAVHCAEVQRRFVARCREAVGRFTCRIFRDRGAANAAGLVGIDLCSVLRQQAVGVAVRGRDFHGRGRTGREHGSAGLRPP